MNEPVPCDSKVESMGDRLILFDTGMGSLKLFGTTTGRMQKSMTEAGLNPADIDAVVIATPVRSHFEVALAALRARDQLRRCNDAIFAATGETPKWFRPPFGFRSPWLGGIAQELHLSTIMWSRIPGDWRTRRSPES